MYYERYCFSLRKKSLRRLNIGIIKRNKNDFLITFACTKMKIGTQGIIDCKQIQGFIKFKNV